MNKLFYILTFLFSNSLLYAQFNSKEFSGVIKLNDSAFIPYKISFVNKNNMFIEGTSITDEGGKHETKSKITGSYHSKTNIFEFKEYDIVYSKSPYGALDFCFIHFESKIKNLSNLKTIKGKFLGKYIDGTSCINGELLLADKRKLEEKIAKLKKRFDKPKYHKKVLPKVIDSVKLKPITTGEDLNVFVKSKVLVLEIYDSGKIDDDKINLYVDDKLVLENFIIRKEKKKIPIVLQKKRLSVKIVAVNEGNSPPNTVKIEVKGSSDYIVTKTALKKNEEAILSLVRK